MGPLGCVNCWLRSAVGWCEFCLGGKGRMPGFRSVLIVILIFGVLSLGRTSGASETLIKNYCQQYPDGETTAKKRIDLLLATQNRLIEAADHARASLEQAANCFNSDNEDDFCATFTADLMNLLADQMFNSKIAKSIGEHRNSSLSSPSVNATLNQINRDKILPDSIANFNHPNFVYGEADKDLVAKLWSSTFVDLVNGEIIEKNLQPSRESCSRFNFESTNAIRTKVAKIGAKVAGEFVKANPLLAFLNDRTVHEPEGVKRALLRLAEHNDEFAEKTEDMEVEHSDGLVSQFNLALGDHEMGLVNFPGFAFQEIFSLPKEERADACASWEHLKNQQSQRVKSSIGVGFTTALGCAVGIWSGIGTVPSLIACTPAVVDGLWGGYKGHVDASIANLAKFSGKRYNSNGRFSGEIFSDAEARDRVTQGRLVMLVNFMGIVPVARGVALATKGSRGTAKSAVKVPLTDSTVSGFEMSVARVTEMMVKLGVIGSGKFTVKSNPNYWKVMDFKNKCQELL